ncbi:MAG TPA: hypothetical protein VIX90_18085 [Edaphobacter sp.]
MADKDTEATKPKYWRLFEVGAATINVASIVAIITILRNPEWHEHLLRLMGRGWDVFVSQDVGSTSRGVINGLFEVFLSIAAVAIMTGYFLGLKKFQKHWLETAIVALFAFPTVAFVIYGTQFAWEVAKAGYEDHEYLKAKNKNLMSDISTLRSHPIVQEVPVTVESKVITAEYLAYTFDLSMHLKGILQSTKVFVSAAPSSPQSKKLASVTTALIADACYRVPSHDCEVGGGGWMANPYTVRKAEYRLSTDPPEKGIIVRSESEDAASMMASTLGKLFSDVIWKQEMPKQMNEFIPHDGYKTFVWVEFGKQVKTHEYVCGGSEGENRSPCVYMLGLDQRANQH